MRLLEFFIPPLVLIALGAISCQKNGFSGSKLSELPNGEVVVYAPNGAARAKHNLNASQLSDFKSLMVKSGDWGPGDLIKKCRFQTTLAFILSDQPGKDSLLVEFCEPCKIWRVSSRTKSYQGNYNTGSDELEAFLNQFIPDSNPSLVNSRPAAVSHESPPGRFAIVKQICDGGLREAVLILPNHDRLLSAESIDDSTLIRRNLVPELVQSLGGMLADRNLYDTVGRRIMCGEPVSAMIRLVNSKNQVSTMYLFDPCDQIAYSIGDTTRAYLCPDLLNKLESFIQINKQK